MPGREVVILDASLAGQEGPVGNERNSVGDTKRCGTRDIHDTASEGTEQEAGDAQHVIAWGTDKARTPPSIKLVEHPSDMPTSRLTSGNISLQ